MSESSELLRAVLEAPDDDLPRLVYADWLEHDATGPCPPPAAEADPCSA